MSRKQLLINGITTNSNYNEGDNYSLINLRHKSNGLEPVLPIKKIKDLGFDLDFVFIHQLNELKRYVGYKVRDNKTDVYIESKDGTLILASTVNDILISVEQFGYILAFVGNEGVYYSKFNVKSNKTFDYVFLGELPDCPSLVISESKPVFNHKTFKQLDLEGGVNKSNFMDRVKSAYHKCIKENTNAEKFLFYDAFILRYALRLFDGSLVKHSPPIVVMPPCSYGSVMEVLYSYKQDSDWVGGFLDNPIHFTLCGFEIILSLDKILGSFSSDWEGIITGIDLFVSRPIGIYNIELFKPTFEDIGTSRDPMDTISHKIIPDSISESVSMIESTSNFYLLKSLNIIGYLKGELDEMKVSLLSDSNEFHRYKNIVFQEEMSDNNMSNHSFGAMVSYNYNKRLHLAGLRTKFFNGFSGYDFYYPQPQTDIYYTKGRWKYVEGSVTYTYPYRTTLGYNGYNIWDNAHEEFFTLKHKDVEGVIFEVTIDTDFGLEKRYSVNDIKGEIPFFSTMISYPDIRAKRIRILAIQKTTKELYLIADMKLRRHNVLNLAYYINSEEFNRVVQDRGYKIYTDKGKIFPVSNIVPTIVTDIRYSDIINIINEGNNSTSILEENKLKVSVNSNPMSFENVNTYQISNGRILAMATNATRVSEGQFGQYPLYIFTTKGIYAMNIGGAEVLYSNVDTPISFDVAISPVLCSTTTGILFVSDRGIKFIGGGQEVNLITIGIEKDSEDINYIIPDKVSYFNELIVNDKPNFKEQLKDIVSMAFNSKENEIIINTKDDIPNYVVQLNNMFIYQTKEKFNHIVQNTYPELLVFKNNAIYDYSDSDSSLADVSFQLRPFSLIGGDYKLLERLILRGSILVENDSLFCLFSSFDEKNLIVSRGGLIKKGKYKDIDLGAIVGNDARYYSVLFTGRLDKDSRLDFIDLYALQKFNNDKLR